MAKQNKPPLKIKGCKILHAKGQKPNVIRWSQRHDPNSFSVDGGNRKWDYKVTKPMLPQDAISAVMDHRQMECWLNDMDASGWEFVGYGQKLWRDTFPQEWWIFRRAR